MAGNDATFWSRSIEGAGNCLRTRRPRRETNSETESHATRTQPVMLSCKAIYFPLAIGWRRLEKKRKEYKR